MLVCDDVQALTAEQVEFGQRFELDLRGKDEHVVAFEVLGLRG